MTDYPANVQKTTEEPISVEELIQRFRSTHGTHRYAETASLRPALDLLKETNDERATQIIYDIRLFDLMTQHDFPERFAPMMSGTQKDGLPWSYPNLDEDFPESALVYYADRIRETDNPFHRAVYADFLFSRGRLNSKDRSACCKVAALNYLEAARTYLAEGEDHAAINGYLRAMDLALTFNRLDLIKASVEATVEAIKHLVATGRPRWTLEMLTFLAPRSAKLSPYFDTAIISQSIAEAIRFYRENEQDAWHIERSFLGVSAEFHKAQKDGSGFAACRLRIAETFVEEADWKRTHYPNGDMVAAHFYDEAIQALSGIEGTRERVEALKVQMMDCNREAKKHYTTFSHEIKFAPDEVERLQQHVDWYGKLTVAQAMAHASINPNILPTWERAEELADQVLRDSIIHQLFSTQVMDGDLKVKTVSEDKDRREYQIVSVHREAMPIGVEELLRDSGFIGETHIHLIVHGVRAYLADEHISALHVLVFQVEGVLRDLLTATGRATFSQETQGEYRHYTLATLLRAGFKTCRRDVMLK